MHAFLRPLLLAGMLLRGARTAASDRGLPPSLIHDPIDEVWSGRGSLERADIEAALDACGSTDMHVSDGCRRARYIATLLKEESRLQTLSISSAAAGQPAAMVRKAASQTPYSVFFWRHEVESDGADAGGALVLSSAAPALNGDAVREAVSCAAGGGLMDACPALSASLQLPPHVVNDIVGPMPADKVPTALRPRIYDLGTAPVEPKQCPLASHTFVLGLAGAAEVRVMGLSEAAAAGARLGGSGVKPHELGLGSDEFWASTSVSYRHAVLAPGDLAFAPRGSTVAVKQATGAGDGDEGGTHVVLKLCVIDPSNYVNAVDAARLALAVDPGVAAFVRQLATARLDAVREPAAATMADRLAGKAVARGRHPEGQREGQREPPFRPAPGGRRRRGAGFQSWQEEKSWLLRVRELTLPRLQAPSVRATTRSTVTLEWVSSYRRPLDKDTVRLGFNVSWTSAAPGAEQGYIEVLASEAKKQPIWHDAKALAMGIETTLVSVELGGFRPSTTYAFAVALFYGDASGTPSEWSARARTKDVSVPAAIPSAPVLAPGGEAGLHDVPLRWTAPLDDGGDPNLRYEIEVRHVRNEVNHADGRWVNVGDVLATPDGEHRRGSVRHLLPMSSYEFRVAAANAVGRGEWSRPSRAIKTRGTIAAGGARVQIEEATTLHGHGSASQLLHARHRAGNATVRQGPMVTLRDRAGEVHIDNEGLGPILAWTAHWSPQVFDVRAELAEAEHRYACRGTGAGDHEVLHHRVALVERGRCPLVEKVHTLQSAGALAVIIADDGRCEQFDQHCVPGSDKVGSLGQHGFARNDLALPWRSVRIPAALVLKEDGDRLRRLIGSLASSQATREAARVGL